MAEPGAAHMILAICVILADIVGGTHCALLAPWLHLILSVVSPDIAKVQPKWEVFRDRARVGSAPGTTASARGHRCRDDPSYSPVRLL